VGDVSRHSEIGVLINSGWDQTWDISLLAKDVLEGAREGWHCLSWGERPFTQILRFVKAKDTLDLVQRDVLLHLQDIWVHVSDILAIAKDKSLLWVEAESNNIFNVVQPVLDALV
jgi:hypothetical protein